MNIVYQLDDDANLPVEFRQANNDKRIDFVIKLIKQALQEQEERIIKKIKSLPRYTFLTDKREFTRQDVISREAVIKILNQLQVQEQHLLLPNKMVFNTLE